jgi:L-ascorbate metabolism protein UlaG (beta-lactamase superfamily)
MLNNTKVYLKPNVQPEPLFNQWYAWPYLISPITAAMYTSNLYIKIMESFIAAPHFHISALQDPKMKGGPFINYDESRVDEIKALLIKSQEDAADLIELAEAIKNLQLLILEEAKGYSIEPLYQKVPDILKGYVELVYDINNQPAVRFIEGLFYKSKFYKESSQTLSLNLVATDERPFIFSTPRLKSENSLHLHQHFNYQGLDELFKMKQIAQPLGFIEEVLDIPSQDSKLFESFFTEVAPPLVNKYDGEEIRIRYFGHACVLIESKDVSILCDPLISYEYGGELPRYTYADLPDCIDYIIITHQHHDHFMLESLLQLRHKTKTVIVPKSYGGELVDPSMKLVLKNIGFSQVIELEEIETLDIPGGTITGIPFLGEHADLKIRSKIAYLVNVQNNTILLGADLNNCESTMYDHVRAALGKVDVVFIGVQCDGAPLSWAYGALLIQPLSRKMDRSRASSGSNYSQAIALIESLKPQEVYVYAMGFEPWLSYLMSFENPEESNSASEAKKLVVDCQNRGIKSDKLYGKKELFINYGRA